MPTNSPTGKETYIYDHKAYHNCDAEHDHRQHCGASYDPSKLPNPQAAEHELPLIMVEPCYASGSTDVFLYFRTGHAVTLKREFAEQLRDALTKVLS